MRKEIINKSIVIFSDLDGTLLHPETYSFEAALPALTRLREKGIPLVFCSSKTKAEIAVWRRLIGNRHPFISENGGGIFIPENYFSFPYPESVIYKTEEERLASSEKDGAYDVISLGKPYKELRKAFSYLRDCLNIRVKGFGEMTAEDISELTGLTLEAASLAKLRDFSEPFVFEGDPDERFLREIENAGLHWTQGKLHHIMGDNDKGKAVNILRGLLEIKLGKVYALGLGDGFNDLPMLKEVDLPVLIPKEDGSYDRRVIIQNMITAKRIGPEGWNEVMIELLGRIT